MSAANVDSANVIAKAIDGYRAAYEAHQKALAEKYAAEVAFTAAARAASQAFEARCAAADALNRAIEAT